MDDKTNLYVFEKKEVFLIFIFMILIAITSFVLGVKIGKTFTYPELNDTLSREQSPAQDQASIAFQSEREEAVNELTQNPSDEPVLDATQQLRETLLEEIAGADRVAPVQPVVETTPEPTPQTSAPDVTGKWTVQLASFNRLEEAEVFAQGFKARGHDTIIREVNLPSRGGIWYRVSLGLFQSLSETTEFMRNNKELFAAEKDATPMQL